MPHLRAVAASRRCRYQHPAVLALLAALFPGAVLCLRPSGLDADALALSDRAASRAAMCRPRRISPSLPLAVVIAEDGRFCEPSRRRLRRAPRCHRRCRQRRGARRLDHHPAGGEEPVPVARAAARSARRWSSRWRCGSTWCCRSGASWKSTSTSPSSGPTASSASRPAAATPSGIRRATLTRDQAALLAAVLPNPVDRNAAQAEPRIAAACRGYVARAAPRSPEVDGC